MLTMNSLNGSLNQSEAPDGSIFKPQWDADLQILFLGHLIVKHYQRPSLAQYTILAAFEEQGWPARINDPLPAANKLEDGQIRDELRAAVTDLNRAQFGQTQIRFQVDESGQGVVWTIRMVAPSKENRAQVGS